MIKVLLLTAAVAAIAAPALAGSCSGQKQASAGEFRLASASHHTPARSQGGAMRSDIVDTAAAAGSFGTLVAAVQAAGLVDTLKGPGPFTVFAPTDAAFAKLPPGTVQTLLRPENRAQLQKILTYHVVPGAITSSQLAGKTAAPVTVQGQILAVDGRSGVTVNNARVVTADVRASNGVIHVIDTVLMPN
jgi:uncharacterized surface protein with fasciclin (FAS1) repeats